MHGSVLFSLWSLFFYNVSELLRSSLTSFCLSLSYTWTDVTSTHCCHFYSTHTRYHLSDKHLWHLPMHYTSLEKENQFQPISFRLFVWNYWDKKKKYHFVFNFHQIMITGFPNFSRQLLYDNTKLYQGPLRKNFFFYTKRVLAKRQQKTLKNIPLIARPCKEDSRRDRSRGWRSS